MNALPLTTTQLQEGIARNNARALDPAQWRLSWLFQRVIPTGAPLIPVSFEVPESAALFLLEYVFVDWVSVGAFREIFLELIDDRGEKFNLFSADMAGNLPRAMRPQLFTSPAGDQNFPMGSAARGAMPIDQKFPGRAQFTINVRGALGTPNPATIDLLCVGHLQNKLR